jgi:hypothetical protein
VLCCACCVLCGVLYVVLGVMCCVVLCGVVWCVVCGVWCVCNDTSYFAAQFDVSP